MPYHHTRVYLNNNLIDDATWSAEAEYGFEITVPQNYLQEGENTIMVECPRDLGITQDILYVNRFEIDYSKTFTVDNDQISFDQVVNGMWEYQIAGFTSNTLEVFDISDPTIPSLITGVSIVPSGASYDLAFEQTTTSNRKFLAQSVGQRLTPAEIIIDDPSDLHSAANSAEYLVITHGDFITEAQRLADYRDCARIEQHGGRCAGYLR